MIGDKRSYIIKSFRFLQQEVMASFRPCPDCAQKGVVSPIVPRRITEEVAVWKCNNPACLYPMSQSLEEFKAQFVPVSTIDERLFRRYINYEVRSESCCSDAVSVVGDAGSNSSPSPPFASSVVVGGVPSPRVLNGVTQLQQHSNGFAMSIANATSAVGATAAPPPANIKAVGTIAENAIISSSGIASTAVTEPIEVNIGEETLSDEQLALRHSPNKKGRLITSLSPEIDSNPVIPTSTRPAVVARSRVVDSPCDDDPTARLKRPLELRNVSPATAAAPPPTQQPLPSKRSKVVVDNAGVVAAIEKADVGVARLPPPPPRPPLPPSAIMLLQRYRRDKEAAAAAAAAAAAYSTVGTATRSRPTSDLCRANNALPSGEKIFVRSKLAKSLLPHSASGAAAALQQDASNFASFQTSVAGGDAAAASKTPRYSPAAIQNLAVPLSAAAPAFPAYATTTSSRQRGRPSANNSLSDEGSDKQSTTSSSTSKNVGGSLLSSAVKKSLKYNIINSQLSLSPSNASPSPSSQIVAGVTPPSSSMSQIAPSPSSSSSYFVVANQDSTGTTYPANQMIAYSTIQSTTPVSSNFNSTGFVDLSSYSTPLSADANAATSSYYASLPPDDAFASAVDIFSPFDDIFGQNDRGGDNNDNDNKSSTLASDTGSAMLLTELNDNEPVVYQELGRMNF